MNFNALVDPVKYKEIIDKRKEVWEKKFAKYTSLRSSTVVEFTKTTIQTFVKPDCLLLFFDNDPLKIVREKHWNKFLVSCVKYFNKNKEVKVAFDIIYKADKLLFSCDYFLQLAKKRKPPAIAKLIQSDYTMRVTLLKKKNIEVSKYLTNFSKFVSYVLDIIPKLAAL